MLSTTEDLEQNLFFLLSDSLRLSALLLDRQLSLAGFELNRSHWRIIAHLARREGVTQTELAELLGMERAPLGSLLDKLEQRGLVERRADPGDRRIRRVYSTATARALLPQIVACAEQLRSLAVEGLSEAQQADLHSSLQLVRHNLLQLRNSTAG